MFIANPSCLIKMKISGLGLIKLNVHVVSSSPGIIRRWETTNQRPAHGCLNQWEARTVWEQRGTVPGVIWKWGQCSSTGWCLGRGTEANCNSMSIGLRSMGTLCHIRSGISDKLMNWAGSYNSEHQINHTLQVTQQQTTHTSDLNAASNTFLKIYKAYNVWLDHL